jgi:sigma-B regulation protein RsbU (phosphoserine phosphatase)
MAAVSFRTDGFFEALFEDNPEELYDNAPCGYLSMLPDGRIVKVNETFLRSTGFSRDELVGRRRFQELLKVGDRIFYETHFAPMLRLQGHVREIAVDVATASGAALPVLVNAVTRFDDHGDPLVVRVAVFDATERRAYEAELVAARARAEASEQKVRALAETLQSSLLPPELPSTAALTVAAAYCPAGDGAEVGGDFYDVFEIGPDNWAVFLGDVCGKGASAAAVTALVRYTLRAAIVTTGSPSAALRVGHDAVRRQRPDTFCTAVLMTVAVDDGIVATIASAGHPLPVVRRANGTTERVGHFGTLLGMVPDHATQEVVVTLGPLDAIVLYTDGVVEARCDGEFFGDARLLEVVRNAGPSPDAIAHSISDAAIDFQSGRARDDIAVVVVGAPAV